MWRWMVAQSHQLTATVDPFFPTPPPRIVENMYHDDHSPHTTVINTIPAHNSMLPNTWWCQYNNNNNSSIIYVDLSNQSK